MSQEPVHSVGMEKAGSASALCCARLGSTLHQVPISLMPKTNILLTNCCRNCCMRQHTQSTQPCQAVML
eukprot:1140429-Pelagomonas_calceolata.AAC.3